MSKEYETNAERIARLEREAKARERATYSDKTKVITKKEEAKEEAKKEGK